MSKDKSRKPDDEFEMDFSDVDLALEDTPEEFTQREPGRYGRNRENFQREFKAVFDEESTEKKKIPFQTMNKDGLVAGVFDWIRCVAYAIAIVVVCLTFVFRLVEVDGTSMNDTLAHHDKVIITNLFYTPHNGDIVVISHGSNYNHPIIKRVIAVGGQTLKLDYENEKIYVDGIEISEPYIKGTTFSGTEPNYQVPTVIPEGKLFVMGDNRHVSLDSRSTEIGLINVDDVIGKAQLVAFPFDHFGYLYD